MLTYADECFRMLTYADILAVLDDYLNLQSVEYHSNKSFCEDLTEGKYRCVCVE